MTGVWVIDLPDSIYGRLVSEFPERLKKKYKFQKVTVNGVTQWLNFSNSSFSDTKPVFPYITFLELPGSEKGRDLEGTSINAALFTFQIDVYDNSKEETTKECMAEIVKIMKSMMFEVKPLPAPDSRPQEYRSTARFSRVISKNDIV